MSSIRRALLLLSSLVFSASLFAAGGNWMVSGPWIREAPPTANALGGFVTLHNHGSEDAALVGATSPAFDHIMLHRTVQQDGMMRMVHQERIEVPAGGMTELAPGGYHLMLMQPKRPLKAGESVDVTLMFSDGSEQEVSFAVRAGGGMGMGHGHMMHH